MPSAGYVAGDGYCKVSDGECWLHNVNIALCTSDVKRLCGPCLSSWAGQLAEAQAARTPPTPARRGAGRRLRSSRGPCLRSDPAASLGCAPGPGSGRLDRARRGQGQALRVSRSHPRSVGSAGTRAPASSSSTTRRARAGCYCTRRPTLALNPSPSPSPGPNVAEALALAPAPAAALTQTALHAKPKANPSLTLTLTKAEIRKLGDQCDRKGLTIVPQSRPSKAAW